MRHWRTFAATIVLTGIVTGCGGDEAEGPGATLTASVRRATETANAGSDYLQAVADDGNQLNGKLMELEPLLRGRPRFDEVEWVRAVESAATSLGVYAKDMRSHSPPPGYEDVDRNIDRSARGFETASESILAGVKQRDASRIEASRGQILQAALDLEAATELLKNGQ